VRDARVRPATGADLDAVMELWCELSRHQEPWRVFAPQSGMETEVRRSYERALTDPGSLVVVAEVEGRIVGTAFGHPVVPSSFSDEPAIELSGVVVSAGDRKTGVGRALVDAIARFARDQGIGRIVIKTFARNEGALEFWRRLGFEPRMVQMVAEPDQIVLPG
jgi:GNAT superfamily N-acetyltransferase